MSQAGHGSASRRRHRIQRRKGAGYQIEGWPQGRFGRVLIVFLGDGDQRKGLRFGLGRGGGFGGGDGDERLVGFGLRLGGCVEPQRPGGGQKAQRSDGFGRRL